jgi:hypothetical protein
MGADFTTAAWGLSSEIISLYGNVENAILGALTEDNAMWHVTNKEIIAKIAELAGWVGMCLIQGATVPTAVKIITGESASLPEFSMVALVWSGLFLFLCRGLVQQDKLAIVSNSVGFFMNSMMLAFIVFGG